MKHNCIEPLEKIIIFYTPGSIDPRGKKPEAKNKYHWRLEVRIFVSGIEGIHNNNYYYLFQRTWT